MSALRTDARKDCGPCRWRVNVHRLSSSGRAASEDAAWRQHPLMLSMTEAELPERNARQDVQRQAAERLALMGRAVSVRLASLCLRYCQSQPHGCYQCSGSAADVPALPATSVLGGCATSAAPAFPCSCAAAAAVRGSEDDYHCAAIGGKARYPLLSVLNCNCSIGVIAI